MNLDGTLRIKLVILPLYKFPTIDNNQIPLISSSIIFLKKYAE
ncbi:unnamed protein product [Meloidogyne enterolobii]|uniref:Uncharacterized protein n=1 Tax=Meloidogyne enterolobii TaxID=390850 RepID=A0ACB1AP32_MELEN